MRAHPRLAVRRLQGRPHPGGRTRLLRAGRRRLGLVLRRGRLQLPPRCRGRYVRLVAGRQGGPGGDDHARAPRARDGVPAREHPRPRVRGGDGQGERTCRNAARARHRGRRAARRRLARGEGLRAGLRRVPLLGRHRPGGDGAGRPIRCELPAAAAFAAPAPLAAASAARALRSGDRGRSRIARRQAGPAAPAPAAGGDRPRALRAVDAPRSARRACTPARRAPGATPPR